MSPSSGSLPTQTVNPSNLPATTTTLTSSLNPSTVGQQVTFTAVVSAGLSPETPTGTVTFTIDGQAQTPVPLSVVGGVDEAKFVTSTLTSGQHSVTAAYSGDSTFASSTVATPLVQVVDAVATTITAVSSANPSSVGEPVTFTATVTPSAGGDPSGSVTFTIDGKAQPPVPRARQERAREASFQISTLSAGKHTVTASYSGDATDATALVTPLVETVNASTVERAEGDAGPAVRRPHASDGPGPLFDTVTRSTTNLQNYVLVGPEGNHIGFKSVSYDSSAHTVTLRPTVKINVHRTYRLTVIGQGPPMVSAVSTTRSWTVPATVSQARIS